MGDIIYTSYHIILGDVQWMKWWDVLARAQGEHHPGSPLKAATTGFLLSRRLAASKRAAGHRKNASCTSTTA